MTAASISEPILVLYKSALCRHCTALSAIWDTPPNKDEDSVTTALKKVYPKLRFFVVTSKDNTGIFDENTVPKDLIRYSMWFPMILLIPGKLWDEAMSKLGPKNEVKLVDGVQIMNGRFEGDSVKYIQEHDIRKPVQFGKWLEKALNNEDFKRVQGGAHSVVVPTQPIQPLLTSIVKSGNSGNNHVRVHDAGHGGDFCSMKIISRPK